MIFQRSKNPGEDIQRFLSMTAKRRQLIDESPDALPVADYPVNQLSRTLHPGMFKAVIAKKEKAGNNSAKITLKPLNGGQFPYFRAGQFITLSSRVDGSFLTRAYSLASSPAEALRGIMEVIVQESGLYSGYLIGKAEIGETVTVGEPSGDFYHDSLRDRNHILAVAGGSGVTPFLSMMKAIQEGSEDFRMTLLYGVRTLGDALFDPNDFRDEKIRIELILSEEKREGYRHGFITADILKDYIDGETSIFLCGPDAMYRYVGSELERLAIDPYAVRRERNSIGRRAVAEEKEFLLTVLIRDERYVLPARNDETLLTAMERAGIPAVSRCRSGVCGFCHSRLIAGEFAISNHEDHRRSADVKFGYVHPCCSYPESDMEIEIPIFNV